MKKYIVKDEFIDKWSIDGEPAVVNEAEIRRLSREWDVPFEELMEQVEFVEETAAGNLELLSEAQELLNLNQRELGIYIGVSARCVNAWMNRERAVPLYVAEMANRLAHVDAVAMAEDRPTTTMSRWAVIRSSGLDEFIDVYGNRADALRAAEVEWKHLTASEKKKAERFLVGLVNVQICDEPMADSRFQQAVLENGNIDADIYDVAKDFLQN